jgi:PrgI family protein
MTRHEIPTHLNVEDTVLLGLTARQLGTLMACAAVGYRVWIQWPNLPGSIRIALAATCMLAGLVLALVRPGGRPLEQWALAGLAYLAAPRRTTWAVAAPKLDDWRPARSSGWVELRPNVAWAASVHQPDEEGLP